MSPNRLIREKSPYLLQHAHNPVDWRPWGEEAFAAARAEEKPIFLSVGYSTCHWCHVMERESFENEEIAAILNSHFVPVKVDREERPDVDRIYMMFVQATSGGGGWPMSVWLTPDRKPFFGGTYFPPDDRYGRPGFKSVLEYLVQAWQTQREEIERSGATVLQQLETHLAEAGRRTLIDVATLESAFLYFRRSFDTTHGGFSPRPKFPRPSIHNFLLRYWLRTQQAEARDMVLATLRAMAKGGIDDHLGGGFHRYSVDERWRVPHFEKMLYDQAQLAVSYVEAYQVTSDEFFAGIARDIFEYVLRDMTSPDGGFYSAEDADSVIDPSRPHQKGEGAFYVWTKQEIAEVLGEPDASRFSGAYGVKDGGNVDEDPHGEFRGKNILFEARPQEPWMEEARRRLLLARSGRVRPHLDDKILTSWNALMISAFAKGAQVLAQEPYLKAATRAAQFIRNHMWKEGKLFRRFREGEASVDGFLDDYAFLALAMLDLYEAGFHTEDLRFAVVLAETIMERFEDAESGGFYSTEAGAEDLVLRMKEDYDGAEPSGNSVATLLLQRLAGITGREDFQKSAQRALEARPVGPATPQMLVAWEYCRSKPRQVILAGERNLPGIEEMLAACHRRLARNQVLLLADEEGRGVLSEWHPAVREMLPVSGKAAAYVCEDFTCRLPATTVEEFEGLLQ